MKTKFNIIYAIAIIIFAGSIYMCNAQSVVIYQNIKLAIAEDDYGNKPFTPNLIGQFIIKKGNVIVFTEFEYAQLKRTYYRTSFNVGYEFNIKRFKTSLSSGYGVITHNRLCSLSASFNAVLGYRFKGFSINLMSQYTQRSDINLWRYSSFIGLQIEL